jgi:hypothetical protein
MAVNKMMASFCPECRAGVKAFAFNREVEQCEMATRGARLLDN